MLLYFGCKDTVFILVTHQSILPTQSHIQKDSHIYTFKHSKDLHILIISISGAKIRVFISVVHQLSTLAHFYLFHHTPSIFSYLFFL